MKHGLQRRFFFYLRDWKNSALAIELKSLLILRPINPDKIALISIMIISYFNLVSFQGISMLSPRNHMILTI